MVINIDKPFGWTSSDVVRKLKYTMIHAGYPRKVKIGHAGTLDPLATGVLLICTEKDTKRVETLQAQAKEYVFT
ncbi:MAG: tRNA pseudouridine(55) synthase, partial [Mucinivorans sp.]